MNFYPPQLVKFFRPEDEHHYQNGGLKFGTLEEYCAVENELQMGARFDGNEGVHTERFKFEGRFLERAKIYGNEFQNVKITGDFGEIRHRASINEWVFCSSIGPYIANLDRGILEGDGTYPGDPTLTNYATFNTEKLLRSVARAISKYPEFVAKKGDIYLLYSPISYIKSAASVVSSDPKVSHKHRLSVREFLKALTEKDRFFLPENEFRITVRFDPAVPPEPGSKPLFPKSVAIRRSTVKFGVMKPSE